MITIIYFIKQVQDQFKKKVEMIKGDYSNNVSKATSNIVRNPISIEDSSAKMTPKALNPQSSAPFKKIEITKSSEMQKDHITPNVKLSPDTAEFNKSQNNSNHPNPKPITSSNLNANTPEFNNSTLTKPKPITSNNTVSPPKVEIPVENSKTLASDPINNKDLDTNVLPTYPGITNVTKPLVKQNIESNIQNIEKEKFVKPNSEVKPKEESTSSKIQTTKQPIKKAEVSVLEKNNLKTTANTTKQVTREEPKSIPDSQISSENPWMTIAKNGKNGDRNKDTQNDQDKQKSSRNNNNQSHQVNHSSNRPVQNAHQSSYQVQQPQQVKTNVWGPRTSGEKRTGADIVKGAPPVHVTTTGAPPSSHSVEIDNAKKYNKHDHDDC